MFTKRIHQWFSFSRGIFFSVLNSSLKRILDMLHISLLKEEKEAEEVFKGIERGREGNGSSFLSNS